MLAVHRGVGVNLGLALILVIDGAKLDHCIIAGNCNVGNPHQLIPLIGRARQLLQGIGVIRQGAQFILHIHHPALGGEAEPGAIVVVPQGFVLHTIIAVGVLTVRIPLRGGSHFTVLIGDHNVGFPGGLRGQFEGHIGEPVHI